MLALWLTTGLLAKVESAKPAVSSGSGGAEGGWQRFLVRKKPKPLVEREDFEEIAAVIASDAPIVEAVEAAKEIAGNIVAIESATPILSAMQRVSESLDAFMLEQSSRAALSARLEADLNAAITVWNAQKVARRRTEEALVLAALARAA